MARERLKYLKGPLHMPPKRQESTYQRNTSVQFQSISPTFSVELSFLSQLRPLKAVFRPSPNSIMSLQATVMKVNISPSSNWQICQIRFQYNNSPHSDCGVQNLFDLT